MRKGGGGDLEHQNATPKQRPVHLRLLCETLRSSASLYPELRGVRYPLGPTCVVKSLVQAFVLSSRSRKYSFQLSGSAATRSARRNDFTSSTSYLFAIYNRVISATGTAFSSREITLIASPAPTSPWRVTAR